MCVLFHVRVYDKGLPRVILYNMTLFQNLTDMKFSPIKIYFHELFIFKSGFERKFNLGNDINRHKTKYSAFFIFTSI